MKTKSASLDTTDKGGSFFVTQPTQAVPRKPGKFCRRGGGLDPVRTADPGGLPQPGLNNFRYYEGQSKSQDRSELNKWQYR